jgi:hypothetical protein
MYSWTSQPKPRWWMISASDQPTVCCQQRHPTCSIRRLCVRLKPKRTMATVHLKYNFDQYWCSRGRGQTCAGNAIPKTPTKRPAAYVAVTTLVVVASLMASTPIARATGMGRIADLRFGYAVGHVAQTEVGSAIKKTSRRMRRMCHKRHGVSSCRRGA